MCASDGTQLPVIPIARPIGGLELFVVRGGRSDGLLGGFVISQHIVPNTRYVWECFRRWAYYLLGTTHLRLVLRPPPFRSGFPAFTATSDSPSINSAAGDGGGASAECWTYRQMRQQA
jgi:hypothetical protein